MKVEEKVYQLIMIKILKLIFIEEKRFGIFKKKKKKDEIGNIVIKIIFI